MAHNREKLFRYGGVTYPFEDPDKLYVETYKKKDREYKELSFVNGLDKPGELLIPMPDMPARKDMENYDLPKSEQVFIRDQEPIAFAMWPQAVKDAYVRNRWHLRRHGKWYLINGNPIWFTGQCWMYNTYWTMEDGTLPIFRMESVEFFWVWHFVERSDNWRGLVDVKCRRLGDTEKGNFIGYEMATRFRRSWFGQQNLSEDEAKKNFLRLVESAKRMPFFFKPVSNVDENPQSKVEFKFPNKRENREAIASRKRIEADISPELLTQDIKELGSRMDFGPSKATWYDGNRLIFYMNDEFGKNKDMDPNDAWSKVWPSLSLENGMRIVGKALFLTTVEDIANSNTLKNAIAMWDDSDPSSLDEKGRTGSGMLRYFRSAYLNGPVDKFGYCDRAEIDDDIDSKLSNWLKQKKYQDIIKDKRKRPRTIHEALLPPENGCDLYPVLLDQRILQLQNGLNWNDEKEQPKAIRGKLIWLGRKLCHQVEFVPDANGKWLVTQHPSQPNLVSTVNGILVPGNPNFVMGNDPIDYLEKNGAGSDAAIAVYRKFDPNVDSKENGIIYGNEEGRQVIMNPWAMQTDQFVALYTDRPDDGEEFFLEQAKACIYWGAPTLIESDRNTIIKMMGVWGMDKFVMRRPASTITAQSTGRNHRGVPARKEVINMYIDALQIHIKDRIATYHIREQLDDFRQFTADTRSKHDVSVASGMALLGAGGVKRVEAAPVQSAVKLSGGLRRYKRIMA